MYRYRIDFEVKAVQGNGSNILGNIQVDDHYIKSDEKSFSRRTAPVLNTPVPSNVCFSKLGSNVRS
jgi:hypothetical protein